METKTETQTVTCATCPFSKHVEDNRYVCTNSATAADSVRGHWEAATDCQEEIKKEQILKRLDDFFAEIEAYKANLRDEEWLAKWYSDPDHFCYEGDEIVGCEDPEPWEYKYRVIFCDGNDIFDEL